MVKEIPPEDWIRVLQHNSPEYCARLILNIPRAQRAALFDKLNIKTAEDWVQFCLRAKIK